MAHSKEYMRAYTLANKERCAEHKKKWYLKNKELTIKRERERFRDKYKNNEEFRIKSLLRRRLLNAVNKGFKKGKALEFLGCSIEEFKTYIASQFKEGMSWDNHGIKGWHIDHVKPCSSFDLTDVEQQKICFHYTNMQPLWAFDNYSKAGKI